MIILTGEGWRSILSRFLPMMDAFAGTLLLTMLFPDLPTPRYLAAMFCAGWLLSSRRPR